jgi:hypothetical protein
VDNPGAVTASATLADFSRNLMYNHTMANIEIANWPDGVDVGSPN